MNFINLTTSKKHIETLKNFYDTLFTEQFPDENERESLENMINYLNLKEQGFYKKNNYHIILAELDEKIIGGIVVDYFEKPNCGVIEFILVDPNFRGQQIATKLLNYIKTVLEQDAQKTNRGLHFIFAEVNDPTKTLLENDSMNPNDRLIFWTKKDYYVLDMTYFQPALSEDTKPVDNLLLIACVFNEHYKQNGIPTKIMLQALYDYLYWAMRIEKPNKDRVFKKIKAQNKLKRIKLLK